MIICDDILEKTCKDMIETILFCLPDATKGTIYRIGPMPVLQAVRVTSGIRDQGLTEIRWGLPELSDYNYPGKTWAQYCDRPGHALEAMGWCVEKQKSWTADNPYEDHRSVRKQLSGEIEDFHHMEPVLVRKDQLYPARLQGLQYPLDYRGSPIWKECDYVVAAVIKIHFKPYRIKRGDSSTKIIKKLSRTLGTELLSLHIRETLAEAQKGLARQRLQSCNALAHDLRNTMIKLGFSFSAINAEIGYLREQWEAQIEKAFPELETRKDILEKLNRLITQGLPGLNGGGKLAKVGEDLLKAQSDMLKLCLMPQVGARWIENRIRPNWQKLLLESHAWDGREAEVGTLIDSLERAIWQGQDEQLASRVSHLPEDLKTQWPRLAYTDFTVDKMLVLQEILDFLDHPQLDIPHRLQTKKVLTSLKALVEIIPEVEERANRIIHSLKNGDSVEDVLSCAG